VEVDCIRVFIDCDYKNRSLPFIATNNFNRTRFGIAPVKLQGLYCHQFCDKYGGTSAVVDTKEKYETVHKLIENNKELGGSGGYVIGLYQGKLLSGMN
jgi:GT2 family glycosyltransferase